MTRASRDVDPSGGGRARFATTHWSVVQAAEHTGSRQAVEALENLCRTYWYPLYVYVRRRGHSAEDAQDLTQAFFAHLLAKDFLRGVAPVKGRFRSFLLSCLQHFLTDEWAKAHAAKRGGDCLRLSLDLLDAPARYEREICLQASAEDLYERRWALDLLDRVLERMRRESVAAGREAVFDHFLGSLWNERPAETGVELGAHLGLGESAVKVAVHRLRRRCRELLREEIAQTVGSPEEVEEELRYLLAVVSR